ncbi:MAG: SDR family NAD(P)-dependent oxidoreductase [Planctomycetota bacterium]
MESGLRERSVWITGASGGIGRALARTFAREGAKLLLTAHSRLDELRAFADDAELGGAETLCLAADVRDAAACERAADAAAERFGRLDACVANAGLWPSEDARMDVLDPARLANTVAINLLGAAHTARAFLRVLARTGPHEDGGGAAFVAIGSTATPWRALPRGLRDGEGRSGSC